MVDIDFLFNLTPEAAKKYIEQSGIKPTWDWDELTGTARRRAFTVAKVMEMDLLQSIKDEVKKAISDGTPYGDFEKNLEPILKKHGFWGKQFAQDVKGWDGKGDPMRIVQLGSPWRMELIYRQNLQTAYSVGRYEEMYQNKIDRPYWKYEAVLDESTRHSHRILDNKVYAADDPVWNEIYPPNGFGCRCSVVSLTAEDLKDENLSLSDKLPNGFAPDKGFDNNPAKIEYAGSIDKWDNDIKALYNTKVKPEIESELDKTKEKTVKSETKPETKPETVSQAKKIADETFEKIFDEMKKDPEFKKAYKRSKGILSGDYNSETLWKGYDDFDTLSTVMSTKVFDGLKKLVGEPHAELVKDVVFNHFKDTRQADNTILKKYAEEKNGTQTLFHKVFIDSDETARAEFNNTFKENLKTKLGITSESDINIAMDKFSKGIEYIGELGNKVLSDLVSNKPITIYRGIDGKMLEANNLTVDDLKTGDVKTFAVNSIESWTMDYERAQKFATSTYGMTNYGVILKQTLNPKEVLFNFITTPKWNPWKNEFEIALANDSQTKSYEIINPTDK